MVLFLCIVLFVPIWVDENIVQLNRPPKKKKGKKIKKQKKNSQLCFFPPKSKETQIKAPAGRVTKVLGCKKSVYLFHATTELCARNHTWCKGAKQIIYRAWGAVLCEVPRLVPAAAIPSFLRKKLILTMDSHDWNWWNFDGEKFFKVCGVQNKWSIHTLSLVFQLKQKENTIILSHFKTRSKVYLSKLLM